VLKGLTAAVLGVMLAVAIEIGMRVIVDRPHRRARRRDRADPALGC
jgi:hypothetical protein